MDGESNFSELELESDRLLGGVGERRLERCLVIAGAGSLVRMSLDCLLGGEGLRCLGFLFIALGGEGGGVTLRLLSFRPVFLGGGEGEGV